MLGGFSERGALLMCPGEIFDVWSLYLEAHGQKE